MDYAMDLATAVDPTISAEPLADADSITHLTAGCVAGVAEHVCLYPLDVVKTRMQSLNPNPKARYSGIGDALLKIMRHEGAARPFRGMSVMVSGAGPAHAMYFACYEKMKRVISGTQNAAHHPFAHAAAGCMATVLHDAVMTPADVVKQRLQMYNSPYRSARGAIADMWRREGFRPFYRSYTTQLTMNVPFQALHFVTYELIQDTFNCQRQYNPTLHMLAGGVAGGVASALTTPLDVCKTLLNTQETTTLAASKQLQISGLFNAAVTIFKCCGLRGFFQGIQARVAYTFPSTAISWLVYESFKDYLSHES